MSAARLTGVLALEQHWTSPLNPGPSLAPALELIHDNHGRRIHSLHRRFSTRDELGVLIDAWLTRNSRFRVLHVSGHGSPGEVCAGRGRACPNRVTLAWLIERLNGRPRGRWLHIGSCATLDLSHSDLQAIADRSGALGISGYTKPVDYCPSAAWEMLWLSRLASTMATRSGFREAADWSQRASRGVFADLGFRTVIAN